MSKNNWFVTNVPRQNPKLTLFCFPYAGGGMTTYMNWPKHLSPDVEVVFIQAPGRGLRIVEAPLDNMDAMVNGILNAIKPKLTGPFAFFGHSLGSRVGFELIKRLKASNMPTPIHFFASGSRAAHIDYDFENWHLLDDDKFKNKLRELNGTPEEVLNNDELMEFIMPLVRADFKIAAEYVADNDKIYCPITVIGGVGDVEITQENLQAWGELTTKNTKVHHVEGDHFFIDTNPEKVLSIVTAVLQDTMQPKQPAMV